MEYTKSVKVVCHSEEAKRPKNLTMTSARDPSLSLRVTNEGSPKITVLGIGNLLLKDEGVGVHMVQKLTGIVDDANVNIIDAGTYPDFLSLVDDSTDKLIIIDAVKAGNKPGTIYRLTLDDLDLDSVPPISLHDIGVSDSLKMMALLNRQPKSMVVIGIEPKTIDFGLEPSPEVEDKLSEMIKLVLQEIEETNRAMEVNK
ncbi:MAG: HyaD/HybD family hydrogenase maturation endopeptidase [Dehalococcoidia bacterium]